MKLHFIIVLSSLLIGLALGDRRTVEFGDGSEDTYQRALDNAKMKYFGNKFGTEYASIDGQDSESDDNDNDNDDDDDDDYRRSQSQYSSAGYERRSRSRSSASLTSNGVTAPESASTAAEPVSTDFSALFAEFFADEYLYGTMVLTALTIALVIGFMFCLCGVMCGYTVSNYYFESRATEVAKYAAVDRRDNDLEV